MFISRHDGNVTTTVQVNTGQRVFFAVVFGVVGYLLIHYAREWHRPDLVLIGALMLLLPIIVMGAASVRIRRSRR